MSGPIALPRPFASRYGVPVLTAVDPAIFTRRYFTHCLACTFCNDWCCQFGVDMDLLRYRTILAHGEAIAAYTGIPRERWFEEGDELDPEFPGGGSRRTQVVDGACVFLNRRGRGCLLHGFALDHGFDYHEFKSIVDCLFPLTFEGGVLGPADEVLDSALVCLDQGPTLYRGIREELRYYFGEGLVAALDALES